MCTHLKSFQSLFEIPGKLGLDAKSRDLTLAPDLGEEGGEDAAALLPEQGHPHRRPADRLPRRLAVGALLVAGDLGDVPPVLGDHPLAQHRLVFVAQRLGTLSRRLWTGYGGLFWGVS